MLPFSNIVMCLFLAPRAQQKLNHLLRVVVSTIMVLVRTTIVSVSTLMVLFSTIKV